MKIYQMKNIEIQYFLLFTPQEKHHEYLMDARGVGFQIGVSCRSPEINAQVYHHIRQMGMHDEKLIPF